jgi:hypothetical protein
LLLIAAVAPSVARAGPPFVTDDPEPVELHHWEMYVASQLNHEPSGWSGTSPHFELNYGAAPNLQLHLIAPVAFDAPKDGSTHVGYGDTELGLKYRFVQERARCPQIGVFPLVELPSGDQVRGLGSGHVQAFLPIWLQKSWGDVHRPWTVYGGGGYWIHPGEGNRDWWYAGAVLQRRLTDHVTVGSEVFHRTAQEARGDGATWLNAGVALDFGDPYHVLMSAGHNVVGASGFQAYVALQMTFGP